MALLMDTWWVMETRERTGMRAETREEGGPSFSRTWLDMIALRPVTRHERVAVRSPGAANALRIVEEALVHTGAGGARSVPSAGALFPYDILIVTTEAASGTSRPVIYRVDLAQAVCIRLPLTVMRTVELHRALAHGQSPDAVDHIVVLARPWLSMRKYGPRGYLYTHLDAGHAATNLLGTALGRGDAALRLRVPRPAVRAVIDDFLPYREVHSVITIAAPTGDSTELSVLDQSRGTPADSHGDLEHFCWSQIPAALPDGGDLPAAVELAPVVAPGDRLASSSRIGRHEWRRLTQLRYSCKAFAPEDQPPSAVARTMSVLSTALPTDLRRLNGERDGGVRISLIIGPGANVGACREKFPSGDVRLVVSDVVGDRDAITRLCFGQRHIGDAQALVLFHIPRERVLLDGHPQVLRDALFRASAAAQLIYLGAARNSVAVTAVGGFDGPGLRDVAGIGDDEEVVYLMALGVDAEGGHKIDRLAAAHAHGE
ncbi:nitroreductase family protein [Streptomyces sp. NRRL S-474]|nr:nitroreductase family protein [Streptomyces sp. NRRL S-474]